MEGLPGSEQLGNAQQAASIVPGPIEDAKDVQSMRVQIVKLMAIKKWIPDNVLSLSKRIPFLADATWLSVIMFALLCFSLFYFARKPLEGDQK